jgi:alpha-L-arabinofuranosidase
MYAAAQQTQANLDQVAATVSQRSPVNAGVPIAVTELGPFFGVSTVPAMHTAYVDQSRTIAAAIYVASVLDALIADPRVFLAAYTNPIHRYYGSLITDTPSGLVKTPTYYLYELYRTRFEPRLVATEVVTSPSFASAELGIVKARKAAPDLLAKASTSGDGKRLSVMLVNRSLDRALSTTIEAKGFVAKAVDCRAVAAAAANAINGPALGPTVAAGGPEIRPRPLDCRVAGGIELTVPPNAIVSVVARQ